MIPSSNRPLWHPDTRPIPPEFASATRSHTTNRDTIVSSITERPQSVHHVQLVRQSTAVFQITRRAEMASPDDALKELIRRLSTVQTNGAAGFTDDVYRQDRAKESRTRFARPSRRTSYYCTLFEVGMPALPAPQAFPETRGRSALAVRTAPTKK